MLFRSSKFNNRRAQFEVGSIFKLTDKVKTHRDYKETFTYPDGKTLTRTETPLNGHINSTFGRLWNSYSYTKPDTTTFYVEASVDPTFCDDFTTNGLMSISDGSDDINLYESNGSRGTQTKLSAYFEHNFAHKQTLVVDFNSSFWFGKSYSDYTEQVLEAKDNLTDIHTMIKDRNQAYAIEADYIKKWENSRFTAGASYTANRNRSVYENLDGQIFHQRQDKVYFFAEYFQKINKLTLTAGIGAQYTDLLFKETNQGSHIIAALDWVAPSLSLTWVYYGVESTMTI